jgi:hypothetical protein
MVISAKDIRKITSEGVQTDKEAADEEFRIENWNDFLDQLNFLSTPISFLFKGADVAKAAGNAADIFFAAMDGGFVIEDILLSDPALDQAKADSRRNGEIQYVKISTENLNMETIISLYNNGTDGKKWDQLTIEEQNDIKQKIVDTINNYKINEAKLKISGYSDDETLMVFSVYTGEKTSITYKMTFKVDTFDGSTASKAMTFSNKK